MIATDSSLLTAQGVGRRKNDGGWLLHEVDLTLQAGSRIAIRGQTGSGKTLLLRALARLDAIDAGEVRWRGEPIHGDAIPKFRQQVIYLQQRPALIEGTVEENLRLPFALRGRRGTQYDRQAIIERLKHIDRQPALLDRTVRELSGGESQIVALLRAIQLAPTVLLLDEPTAALDEASTLGIERLIDGWYGEVRGQRAFLWVSHNSEQVERVGDQTLFMQGGRLSSQQEGPEGTRR